MLRCWIRILPRAVTIVLTGAGIVSPCLVFQDPLVDACCRNPNRAHDPDDRKSALRNKALNRTQTYAKPLGCLGKAPKDWFFGVVWCGLVGCFGRI